jgi:hypothetical protein
LSDKEGDLRAMREYRRAPTSCPHCLAFSGRALCLFGILGISIKVGSPILPIKEAKSLHFDSDDPEGDVCSKP